MKIFAAILTALALVGCQGSATAQTSIPLGEDAQRRPTAEVMINGQGPFEMVIDTAAQRTGLGQNLIERLSLSSTTTAGLHGAAGAATVNLYRLPSISLAGTTRTDVTAIQMMHDSQAGAHDGVFGMDAFVGQRVEFDYEHSLLKVDQMPGRSVPADFTAIPARFVIGTFTIVPVVLNGVRADALVDTGARHSIANPLLMQALGYSLNDRRLTTAQGHGGATNQANTMTSGGEATLKIGAVDMGRIAVSFADLPVFSSLGLADRPAIILGADAWRALKAMAIDYEREELQLRP